MLRTTCYHLYIIDTYFFIKWTKSEQLSLVANAPINNPQLVMSQEQETVD